MVVHYSRLYRYFALFMGVLNVVMGVVASNTLSLVVGAVFIVLGAIALSSVYVRIENNVITLYALLAPFKRRIPFQSPDDITVVGPRLFVKTEGVTRMINAPTWMVNQTEWARLQDNFLEKGDAR
ncbi:MAG: hypothetical protein R3E39_12160 [Anaerolineae bacterium]